MNQFNTQMLNYFSNIIEKETGIQYNEINAHHLNSRILELSRQLKYPDVEEFWSDVLKNGLTPQAKSLILDLATNNETSFFRDPEVFEFFKSHFILKAMSNTPKIRIWCAATSTGQEPYSLAIIFDQLKRNGVLKAYEIFATDISDRVLKQASNGIFSQLEVQRGLSQALIAEYFNVIASDSSQLPFYKAKSELSAQMTFKRLNLLDHWSGMDKFHIIFCRNVLIYQNVENKKNVISRFSQYLYPGGYLVLGGAESLLGLSNDYDMEQYQNACVYKLKSGGN